MPAQTGVSIELDLGAQLADLDIPLDDRKINVAVTRALRKTLRWVRGQVERAIAAETGVTKKSLKNRFKVSVKAGQNYGSLWLALTKLMRRRLVGCARIEWVLLRRAGYLKVRFMAECLAPKSVYGVVLFVGREARSVAVKMAAFQSSE